MTRSPASAAVSAFVQKAAATSVSSGCMKMTEPPAATVSRSSSASAETVSGVLVSPTMSMSGSVSREEVECRAVPLLCVLPVDAVARLADREKLVGWELSGDAAHQLGRRKQVRSAGDQQ